MKNLITSNLAKFCIAAAMLYIVLWVVLPVGLLIDVANGLFLGVAISVFAILAPLIRKAFADGEFDRITQLTFGMFITWVSVFIARMLSVLHRAGIVDEVSILNSPWVSFGAFLAMIGGTLYITAPGMVGGSLKYNKRYLIGSAIVGIIFAITAFFLQRP